MISSDQFSGNKNGCKISLCFNGGRPIYFKQADGAITLLSTLTN